MQDKWGQPIDEDYARRSRLPKPPKSTGLRASGCDSILQSKLLQQRHPGCIERIRAIKELQQRTRLPLRQIKDLVDDERGADALAQSIVHAQQAMLDAVSPALRGTVMSLAEAAEGFDLEPGFVERLVELGIVSLRDGGFRGPDVEVLATLGKMNAAGLNAGSGFRPEDLIIYRDALRALLQREVESFMDVVMTRGAKLTPDLAREAVDGATMLLHAMRKKIVADYLQTAVDEVPASLRPAPEK